MMASENWVCTLKQAIPLMTINLTRPTGDTVVELSWFLVNFEVIELEHDDLIDEDNFYNGDDDIELKDPFEVNLLA